MPFVSVSPVLTHRGGRRTKPTATTTTTKTQGFQACRSPLSSLSLIQVPCRWCSERRSSAFFFISSSASAMAASTPVVNSNAPKAGEFKGNAAPQVQQRWIPDHRDALIGWLRGEFAAANAMIDGLCQHLQLTGAPGEYDFVLGAIQQRRFTWNGILHMQQYFSVSEVLFALQQVLLRKQRLAGAKGFIRGESRPPRKDFRTSPNRRTTCSSESRDSEAALHAETDVNSAESEEEPQPGELSASKEPEPVLRAVEGVGGAKVTVAEGLLYNRAIGVAEATELATKILDQVTGNKTCIKGKLENPSTVTPGLEGEKPAAQEPVHQLVKSLTHRLQLQGVIQENTTADAFRVYTVEEEDSIVLEEQPHYVIPLMSESTLVIGKKNVKSEAGPSSLRLAAGSVLKLEGARQASVAVTAAPSRRVLLFLTMSLAEEKPAGQEDKSSTATTTRTTGTLTGVARTPSSFSSSSSSSSCSSSNHKLKSKPQQQQQSNKQQPPLLQAAWSSQQQHQRPGTGVYIPNSAAASVRMNFRTCVEQDVR